MDQGGNKAGLYVNYMPFRFVYSKFLSFKFFSDLFTNLMSFCAQGEMGMPGPRGYRGSPVR